MIRTVPGLTCLASRAIPRQTVDCTSTFTFLAWVNNRTASARQDWKVQAIIQVPYIYGQVGS